MKMPVRILLAVLCAALIVALPLFSSSICLIIASITSTSRAIDMSSFDFDFL